MALVQGEDYEVRENGVIDLNQSAVEKLWEMGTPIPTVKDADAFLEDALNMVRSLGFDV